MSLGARGFVVMLAIIYNLKIIPSINNNQYEYNQHILKKF